MKKLGLKLNSEQVSLDSNQEINELEMVSVKNASKDSFIYLSSINQ